MWLLMKWIVKKDDLESYRAKFHGKLAGYAEEAKMIALPTPKYFIVVVDEEKIHLIQLDLQFHEKGMQTIMIHEITKLQLGGVVNKKVQIQTPALAFRESCYSGVPTILINSSIFLIFICLITNCSRLFHFPSTSNWYLFKGRRKT